jgi:thioredoxin-like negative regulator of GroEL
VQVEAAADREQREPLVQQQAVVKPNFVLFYDPMCPHCKEMMPAWRQLQARYNNPSRGFESPVKLVSIDCRADANYCEQHEVDGYPTMMLYRPGQRSGVSYEGDRDVQSIEDWLRSQLFVKN